VIERRVGGPRPTERAPKTDGPSPLWLLWAGLVVLSSGGRWFELAPIVGCDAVRAEKDLSDGIVEAAQDKGNGDVYLSWKACDASD